MALNAKTAPGGGSGGSFPTLAAGTYPARLAQVIGIGLMPQSYKSEAKPPKQEIMLTWELVDEFGFDEDGNEMTDKPRWVTDRFPLNNLGSEKAKSTIRYYALDPNEVHEGDFSLLVGIPAMITLSVSKDGKYNNVAMVSAMRTKEADKLPELSQNPRVFDFDEPDLEIYNSLAPWVHRVIEKGLEYEGSTLQRLVGDTSPEDDVSKETDDDDGDW